MTLWLTAVTPTFRAGTDKLANDPCPCVRLPRTGWALDGKHVAIELTGNPARRVEGPLARLLEYSVRGICRRRFPQQKSSGHPVGCSEVKSIAEDRFAEPHERLPQCLGPYERMKHSALRMEVRRSLRLLDVNGSCGKVDVPLPPPSLVPSSP